MFRAFRSWSGLIKQPFYLKGQGLKPRNSDLAPQDSRLRKLECNFLISTGLFYQPDFCLFSLILSLWKDFPSVGGTLLSRALLPGKSVGPTEKPKPPALKAGGLNSTLPANIQRLDQLAIFDNILVA